MDAILAKLDEKFKKGYYDYWMEDNTCSYVLRHRNDDRLRENFEDVCHARAYPNNIPAQQIKKHGTIRSVTTSIWRYDLDSKEFVDWILDKERSPWRGLFQNMTIHRDENKIYAVTIDDLDKQDITSDYVLNFLIATRIHSEKEREFKMWKTAREHGFNEAEALVIATHLWEADVGKTIHLHNHNAGHFPLDAVADYFGDKRDGFINSVSRLEEARPLKKAGLWSACAKPNPINSCWKEFDKKPIKYFNQLAEKNLGSVVYAGSLGASANVLAALGITIVQTKGSGDEVYLSWDILKEKKHEWRV